VLGHNKTKEMVLSHREFVWNRAISDAATRRARKDMLSFFLFFLAFSLTSSLPITESELFASYVKRLIQVSVFEGREVCNLCIDSRSSTGEYYPDVGNRNSEEREAEHCESAFCCDLS
jgi:hypothetical protein